MYVHTWSCETGGVGGGGQADRYRAKGGSSKLSSREKVRTQGIESTFGEVALLVHRHRPEVDLPPFR